MEVDFDVKEQPWAQVRMITTKRLCNSILFTLEPEVIRRTHYFGDRFVFSWEINLVKIDNVPTHNKNIFVRPKKVCLFWE